jgi:hypothetical protein
MLFFSKKEIQTKFETFKYFPIHYAFFTFGIFSVTIFFYSKTSDNVWICSAYYVVFQYNRSIEVCGIFIWSLLIALQLSLSCLPVSMPTYYIKFFILSFCFVALCGDACPTLKTLIHCIAVWFFVFSPSSLRKFTHTPTRFKVLWIKQCSSEDVVWWICSFALLARRSELSWQNVCTSKVMYKGNKQVS